MHDDYDYLFKIIIVGDGGVGKTAISVRFAEGVFHEDYKMTIGVDFSIKSIDIPINGKTYRIKLQIWDTGGQERFSYTRPLYYKGASGGLIVFDLTNRKSFENLNRWFVEVKDVCLSIPLILVGNKSDLPDRAISLAECETIAKERNITYFESSAKSGQSIDSIFKNLGKTIIMKEIGMVAQEEDDDTDQNYKENLETYMNLADYAFNEINKPNYQEALKYLKQAYKYAKVIDYQDGMRWIEDQTRFILDVLNKQKAENVQKPSIYMYCTYCNTQYRVSRIGKIACPQCGKYLSS
ncbi:MAG: GTP-binding protein [Promethearchaeota archaeon]